MGNAVDLPPSWHAHEAGMSLMELVMVIAVIGAVSVTAMAKFMGDQSEAENYCDGLAQTLVGCLEADVRTAQSHAMLRAPGYSIVQEAAPQHQYKIIDEHGTRVGQARTFSDKVTMTPFSIVFDGLGRPSWWGDLTLTQQTGGDPAVQTIGILHIEKNTGAVWVVQQ
ncbi:MAG: hypothetical protein HQL85_14200 [Magnetococcales bacterium]|nr:hypothetical protein [Magnetococcales bacterium]MBF0630638.1 hypothetical protein [Magnetococcales bacterium]